MFQLIFCFEIYLTKYNTKNFFMKQNIFLKIVYLIT